MKLLISIEIIIRNTFFGRASGIEMSFEPVKLNTERCISETHMNSSLCQDRGIESGGSGDGEVCTVLKVRFLV